MFLVISYDIVIDRRRTKLAKLLEDFGGRRVQRSVFECHLEEAQLRRLRQKLGKLVDETTDSVRIYTLCAACQPKIEYIGLAAPTDAPGLLII